MLTEACDLAECFGTVICGFFSVRPSFRFKRIYHKFAAHHVNVGAAEVGTKVMVLGFRV